MDGTPYSAWLSNLARAAGYNPESGGGGRAKIAELTGLNATHVGRVLDGKVKPDIVTMKKLVDVLHEKTKVTILDMLVKVGDLDPADVPQPGATAPEVREIDLWVLAERMDVPEDQRSLFAGLVESVADQLSGGQKGSTVSGHATQTGGKSSAEG